MPWRPAATSWCSSSSTAACGAPGGLRATPSATTSPLDAVRAYLEAATVAVSGWTEAFARDLAAVPAAQQLAGEHNEYLFAVTCTLLDLAVERGDIPDVDTAAVSRVLAGLGGFFSRPDVIPTLRSSPKEAADGVVDLVLRGLLSLPMEEWV